MEKERMATYQRISKGKDIDESIIEQKLALQHYAEDKNWEIVKSYVDIHKSTCEERPEFNQLINDIDSGKINKLVVVGSIERLSRNISLINKISEMVDLYCIYPICEPALVTIKMNKI